MTPNDSNAVMTDAGESNESDLSCWQYEYWKPIRPPRRRRPIWCGLIGTLAGFFAGGAFHAKAYSANYFGQVRSEAQDLIHAVCIGAAIGFGIELFAEGTWPTRLPRFRLRTLFVVFYVIGVVAFTVRNYLILISL